MSDDETGFDHVGRFEDWHWLGWVLVLWVAVAVAAAVSDRPQVFDGAPDTVLFAVAVVLLVACGSWALSEAGQRLDVRIRLALAVVALGAWTGLMLVDQPWSVALFAIYALCFSFGVRLGLVLAAYATIVWAVALFSFGAPLWGAMMPLGVFVVSSILAVTIQRISELNQRQTDLISELRTTQRDLVASERTKGVLAERTRMAAEIHDTLAQGFTSIVLLSRAGLRSGDAAEALKSIEETAQENLGDARRLIEAIRPPELGAGSLSMALQRQLDAALPERVTRAFSVEGDPRPLSGAVEVTVLRAAQEALLNVRTHAHADAVDMVLRFTDESVTLDVRDDGIGFAPGEVNDRGDLTGGQGLQLLRRRAESLAGRLDLGPGGNGRGSLLSLTLPATAAASASASGP